VSLVFDTHSHIQFSAFDDDRDEVLRRALESGVERIVACGDDIPSTEAAFALASWYPNVVLPTAGVHPHEAAKTDAAVLQVIESWAARPECVAVGEIGLDYFREISPRKEQHRILEHQLAMAARLGLPVIVHSRGAEDVAIGPLGDYARAAVGLRDARRPVGVMHCFGGTLEQATAYVEAGFVVSLACPVTYPKNDESRRIARELPIESLVVETDSPFLPPHGRRGQRNEPAWIHAAVSEIASARGITVENAAGTMTETACRLFGVPVPRRAVTA